MIACTGYYDQDAGFLPKFPGEARFRGRRVHPQHWPENLDYAGKQVVVIGSGATAFTLVPAMADATAHITLLQRSPSYVVSVPGFDSMSKVLSLFLPNSLVYGFARLRNIAVQRGLYLACRRWPKQMRSLLLSMVRKHVGKDFDMQHFTPAYMPWDQRVCAVPDADLFLKLKSGKASIVTEQIDTFTETGIRLKSGKELPADIIVSATGLNLQLLGGIQLSVDGVNSNLQERMTYKGVMVEGIPQPGMRVRLRQCTVDAQGRPDGGLCSSSSQAHGCHRSSVAFRTMPKTTGRRPAFSEPCHRAMYSVARRSCRARAADIPGMCRITMVATEKCC